MNIKQMRKEKKSYKKLVFLLFMAVIVPGVKQTSQILTAAEPLTLRCIVFYSSVNGVNSTISHITQSILDHLNTTETDGNDKNNKSNKKEGDVSLSVYCLDAEYYSSLEYKIDTAQALDMDVIILADMPEDADASIYEKLEENGIYLIIVDGEPADYDLSACIGTDNREAGVSVAKMLAEKEEPVQAGIVATLFRNGQISSSRRERKNGFLDEAKNYENLKTEEICVCSSDTLEAMQKMREYLEKYPDMNVLYCLDSASGVIVSKILTEQGRTDEVYVICFDDTEQVKKEMQQGGIDAVLVQNTDKTGQECAEFLQNMAKNQDRSDFYRTQIGVPCKIITSDEAQ